MNVVKYIICELTGYRPAVVDVSQGDRGSRAVSCRLLENGAPWMIPEGTTARVAYTLPDGTEGLYDALPDGSPAGVISGNTVTVELADQLMAQAGMAQMSVVLIGPAGGQLAAWPIRVMVSANSAARLTVPENMPPYGVGFAGKIFFGGADGTVTPLALGAGVEIVRQEDGSFTLIAVGGGGGGGIQEETDPTVADWAKKGKPEPYGPENVPPYPVTSVNGKTGEVALGAADVGARPYTWVPTAQEVGAMPAGTKIPAKTSDLSNDSGFITKSVADLTNYYTKAQTEDLIAQIPKFRILVVQQLPAVGEERVLYLVPFATAEGQYLEYVWVDGRFEVIGSQRVDLTGYATEEWVQAGYQPKGDYALADSVPTKVSQLPNDAGYLTQHQDISHLLPKNLGAENVGKVLVVGGDGNIVLTELPQGGDVTGTLDENNNILLSGDLAEGTYTLKWRNADGTYSDAGTIVVGTVEPEATNYFDASTALLNHRLGSSGSPSAYDGMVVTDFIPLEDIPEDAFFHYSGVTLTVSTAYNYARRTVWYDAAKTKIAEDNGQTLTPGSTRLTPAHPGTGAASYVRIAMVLRDNEPITADDIADLRITLE